MKHKIILSLFCFVFLATISIPFFAFGQYGTLVPIDIGDGTQTTTPDPLFGNNPQPIPGNNPSCPGGGPCISNPLTGNVNDITSFVTYVLQNIVLPIGVVVVVFLVIYSGFLFVTAQGNSDKISEAKKTFLYVLIGSAILLGSVVIAQAIQSTVCKITPSACSSQGVPSNIIR